MGAYAAEEIGSMSFQVPNGNVDILVKDDAAAIEAVKKYLSYFQGTASDWEAPDQRRMRHIIPENRVRTYDMRDIIDTLADEGSVQQGRLDPCGLQRVADCPGQVLLDPRVRSLSVVRVALPDEVRVVFSEVGGVSAAADEHRAPGLHLSVHPLPAPTLVVGHRQNGGEDCHGC